MAPCPQGCDKPDRRPRRRRATAPQQIKTVIFAFEDLPPTWRRLPYVPGTGRPRSQGGVPSPEDATGVAWWVAAALTKQPHPPGFPEGAMTVRRGEPSGGFKTPGGPTLPRCVRAGRWGYLRPRGVPRPPQGSILYCFILYFIILCYTLILYILDLRPAKEGPPI